MQPMTQELMIISFIFARFHSVQLHEDLVYNFFPFLVTPTSPGKYMLFNMHISPSFVSLQSANSFL